MKTLLTLFVLLFSSSVVAEDISDLKINGIGLFESLSKHYSKNEIEKNIKINKDFYTEYGYDDTFIELSFFVNGYYDAMAFYIKPEDPEFIIWGINGKKEFNNFNRCLDKKQREEKKLTDTFFDSKISYFKGPHGLDPSGKSHVESTFLLLDSEIHIEISCYDFDKSMQNEGANWDHFAIYIDSKELLSWADLPN